MMNNINNQFLDFMRPYTNPEFFTNAMKNMPMMDFSSFTNIIKKNAETLTAINQLTAENIQSIVKRGAEVCQHGASEMLNNIRDVMAAPDPQQAAELQQQHIKNAVENSINNTKEMVDMVSKSTMEIVEAFGKNIAENINHTLDKQKNNL